LFEKSFPSSRRRASFKVGEEGVLLVIGIITGVAQVVIVLEAET
jgi:hypothetical protein